MPENENSTNGTQHMESTVPDQKNRTSTALKHYQAIYQDLDPLEIAKRCNMDYNVETREFSFTLAGLAYQASWPDFTMPSKGTHPDGNDYERILMLRYLCEGQFTPATGRELHYREIPGAAVYERNFIGRVNMRLLKAFAQDLDSLQAIMEDDSSFIAHPLPKCDLGYRFDLLDGLPMSLRFWCGDDELPDSVVVLFDSSLQFAFSAEDFAVAGGILADHLLFLRDQMPQT